MKLSRLAGLFPPFGGLAGPTPTPARYFLVPLAAVRWAPAATVEPSAAVRWAPPSGSSGIDPSAAQSRPPV